jgi:hypothetical protein
MRPAVFKTVQAWLHRFFAPAFQLLGDLPPHAVNRLFAPF